MRLRLSQRGNFRNELEMCCRNDMLTLLLVLASDEAMRSLTFSSP
jgi:hypothetical protein